MRLRGLATVLLVASCGAPEARSGPQLGGDVVAIVSGRPITRSEVERVARERRISARAALDEIESREILADYAARRGLSESAREHLHERVLVQALLARVEREHPVRGPDDAAGIARRSEAAGAIVARGRNRISLDYRASAVTRLLGDDSLFEGVR